LAFWKPDPERSRRRPTGFPGLFVALAFSPFAPKRRARRLVPLRPKKLGGAPALSPAAFLLEMVFSLLALSRGFVTAQVSSRVSEECTIFVLAFSCRAVRSGGWFELSLSRPLDLSLA
jgi:hypothetical protein